MELVNQPINMTVLKTFNDQAGNQYELRGQKNMQTYGSCNRTNYYELYKKAGASKGFEKVASKEEVYANLFNGFEPLMIQKEKFENGNVVETAKVTRQLNGYDIEHQSKSLSMKGVLRYLHIKENNITKIKLPDKIDIKGYERLSSMTKRIINLLAHI